MKKSTSKNLVIDASVARASGGEIAVHPTSTITRNFLNTVSAMCHKVVMTPAIRNEWNQHQSSFSRKWRSSMIARKNVILLNIEERHDIRQPIELEDVTPEQKDAMLKDCHLLEAAIATDKQIVSLDDKARKLFVGLSHRVTSIQDIMWINPVSDTEKVMTWLEGGSDEAKWKLTPNA